MTRSALYSIFYILMFSVFSSHAISDYRSGWGELSEKFDRSRGARIIEVKPGGLKPANTSIYASWVEIGAKWISTTPDNVVLVIETVSTSSSRQTTFQSVAFSFGNETLEFQVLEDNEYFNSITNPVSQSTFTISRAKVSIPLPVFEKVLRAEKCQLKVNYQGGVEHIDFSYLHDDYDVQFALSTLRSFLARVKAKLKYH